MGSLDAVINYSFDTSRLDELTISIKYFFIRHDSSLASVNTLLSLPSTLFLYVNTLSFRVTYGGSHTEHFTTEKSFNTFFLHRNINLFLQHSISNSLVISTLHSLFNTLLSKVRTSVICKVTKGEFMSPLDEHVLLPFTISTFKTYCTQHSRCKTPSEFGDL